MKSRGTSKAEEMDWEKGFEKLEARDDMMLGIRMTYVKLFGEHNTQHLKDFIRKAIQQAIAQERERIAEEIEVHFLERAIGDKHFDIRDEVINVITNNHEDHKE